MIKKYLILLIMFLICYNSYANLDNIYMKSEVNFESITIGEAFQIIGQESGIDFFTDEEVKNIELSLDFTKGEKLSTVVKVICESHKLKVYSIENMYIVSKKEDINKRFCITGTIKSMKYNTAIQGVKIQVMNGKNLTFYSSFNGKYLIPNIEPGVYILNFEKSGYNSEYELINVKDRVTILDINLEKSNKLISGDNFREDRELINQISKINKFITKKIVLNKFEAEDIKNILTNNYGEKLKVSVLARQNIVVVSGDNIVVNDVLNFIRELEDGIKQVRISAQILDVTNNLFETLGFNWAYNSNRLNGSKNNKDITVGILNNGSTIGIGQVYNSSINIIRHFNSGNDILNLGINILESTQDLVVSARPSILVVDGEEGIFKVTEEVIVGNKKYENNSNDKVTYTPIFKEAGIILKVKPHIKNGNEIILDTLIEVSNFKLKKQEDNLGNEGTFNSEGGSKVGRSIKTTIKIKDGQTIFIGGLKKTIVHNLDSKIPFFGTLPMVRYLFKNEHVNHEMSDVYIKLKVDIVENEACEFDKDELHQKVSEIVNNRIY